MDVPDVPSISTPPPPSSTPHANSLSTRPISGSSTHALRHSVLWPSVPLSEQAQPYDEAEGTVHLGAFLSSPDSSPLATEPIGVLTLVIAPVRSSDLGSSDSPQVQLRKFAVAHEFQGRGVGSAMLAAAVEHARHMAPQATLLHLDARREQVAFYQRRVFEVLDAEVFVKTGPGGRGPGVEYVRMGRIV